MTAEEFLDAPEETAGVPVSDLPDWRNVGRVVPLRPEKEMTAEEFLDAEPLAVGPNRGEADLENWLDAPLENTGDFLRMHADAEPKRIVDALDEYDADETRVLTPQEYRAREAALAKLPVGERVARMWRGGQAALGAVAETLARLGNEVPSPAALIADAALRMTGNGGNGALDRAGETVRELPGAAANAVRLGALSGLDVISQLRDVDTDPQTTPFDTGRRSEKAYQNYILRKGIMQQRAEIAKTTKLPGVEGVGAMVMDPMNVLPFGGGLRGGSVAGSAVRRAAGAAGRAVEVPAAGVANAIEAVEGAVGRRAAALGITPEVARALKVTGAAAGGGLLLSGVAGENNEVGGAAAALLGLPAGVSAAKYAARLLQGSGAAVNRGARESLSATGLPVREFARDLAGDVAIPERYRSQMIAGRPVESPFGRAARNTGLATPARRMAAAVDASGLPRLVENAGGLAGSALDGAVLNAMMMQGRSDEEMGGALAMGAAFGAAGRVVNRLSGAERRVMEDGDVARMLASLAADGADYSAMVDLPHNVLAEVAAAQGVFGGNVALRPLRDADFRAEMGARGVNMDARGVHISEPGKAGDGEIFVNVDKMRDSGSHVWLHEFAHALQKSSLLDGGMREATRGLVDDLFSPEQRAKAAYGYAAKLAGSDVPAGVMRKMVEMDAADTARGALPGDWVRDELWAETFASSKRGIDFWKARGRGPGVLRSVARSLMGLGVPLDPATGRVLVDSPLFGKMQGLMKGSVLERRMNDYVRAYSRWIDGTPTREADAGAVVFDRGVPQRSRFVALAEVAPGVRENQFMREVNGRLAFKTQKEIDAEFASREATFKSMRTLARPVKSRAEWGAHSSPDGKRLVGGAVLPERFHQQPNVGPYLKAVEAEMAAAQAAGRSVRVVYHKIGSTGKKGYRVKNLGNLKADVLEVLPFWRSISTADNVLVHMLDMDQFRRNAIKAVNRERVPEFNNNVAEIEAGLQQLLDNHAKNLPGDNGIGTRKRDALNSLMGIGTIANKRANPLVDGAGYVKSAVKTLRLDRIEIARPGERGLAFDYTKSNENLMPEDWRGGREIEDIPLGKSGGNGRRIHGNGEQQQIKTGPAKQSIGGEDPSASKIAGEIGGLR